MVSGRLGSYDLAWNRIRIDQECTRGSLSLQNDLRALISVPLGKFHPQTSQKTQAWFNQSNPVADLVRNDIGSQYSIWYAIVAILNVIYIRKNQNPRRFSSISDAGFLKIRLLL